MTYWRWNVQVKHLCGDRADFVGRSLQGQACGVPEAVGIGSAVGHRCVTARRNSDLEFGHGTSLVWRWIGCS